MSNRRSIEQGIERPRAKAPSVGTCEIGQRLAQISPVFSGVFYRKERILFEIILVNSRIADTIRPSPSTNALIALDPFFKDEP